MRADQAIEMLKTLPPDQWVTVIVGNAPTITGPFYVPADPYWYNHGFRVTCTNETQNKTS